MVDVTEPVTSIPVPGNGGEGTVNQPAATDKKPSVVDSLLNHFRKANEPQVAPPEPPPESGSPATPSDFASKLGEMGSQASVVGSLPDASPREDALAGAQVVNGPNPTPSEASPSPAETSFQAPTLPNTPPEGGSGLPSELGSVPPHNEAQGNTPTITPDLGNIGSSQPQTEGVATQGNVSESPEERKARVLQQAKEALADIIEIMEQNKT